MTKDVSNHPPAALTQALVDLLDVEEIDIDLYRGSRQPDGAGRVFGGQVIAQALQAAQRSTVSSRAPHSLHAYFMRPGNEDFPIIYRVMRDFDGGSFANRRVVAMQQGKPIFNMAASFQKPEPGLTHQDSIPDVPGPDLLQPDTELRREIASRIPEKRRAQLLRARPIEIRPVDPRSWFPPDRRKPEQANWLRLVSPIGDDMAMHRAILAYASDMSLLSTAMLPHGVNWLTNDLQTASLDHALWFHAPFRVDEWLLYTCDSPWSGHARGLARGRIFSADGRLVASTAQEGLMRLRD